MSPVAPFCIRRAVDPPPPPDLRAPGGGEVRYLREGSVAVWFAEGSPGPPTLQAIAGHDAVIRAALRSATPLPARYGISFPDEAALRESLREREATLVEALERVRDHVEMGLRITWDPAPLPEDREVEVHGGRAYLLARRAVLDRQEEERRRASALLDEVEAQVAPEGTPSVRKLLPEMGVAGLLAHLVHRQEVRTYRSRVDAARERVKGADLHLTGPWAPYSFV